MSCNLIYISPLWLSPIATLFLIYFIIYLTIIYLFFYSEEETGQILTLQDHLKYTSESKKKVIKSTKTKNGD